MCSEAGVEAARCGRGEGSVPVRTSTRGSRHDDLLTSRTTCTDTRTLVAAGQARVVLWVHDH